MTDVTTVEQSFAPEWPENSNECAGSVITRFNRPSRAPGETCFMASAQRIRLPPLVSRGPAWRGFRHSRRGA
jgi:hypothetical protein